MGNSIPWGLAWLLVLLLTPLLWEMAMEPAERSGHWRSPGPAQGLDLQRRGLAEMGELQGWRGSTGAGEGRGPQRCALSSRCAGPSVLAGPEEGRAGPAWGRPGWDPSTSHPPAPSQDGEQGQHPVPARREHRS